VTAAAADRDRLVATARGWSRRVRGLMACMYDARTAGRKDVVAVLGPQLVAALAEEAAAWAAADEG